MKFNHTRTGGTSADQSGRFAIAAAKSNSSSVLAEAEAYTDAAIAAIVSPVITTVTAATNLNGNYAVRINSSGLADIPSISVLIDGLGIIGITTGAIATGATGPIQTSGLMFEPSWTWTPGLPVYVADLGALTQVAPPGKWILQIGVAEAATRLMINLGLIISTPV